jgi:hypothetical protein
MGGVRDIPSRACVFLQNCLSVCHVVLLCSRQCSLLPSLRSSHQHAVAAFHGV